MTSEGTKETIFFLKNKVLENVKECVKKSRRRRDSSVGSIASIAIIASNSSTKRKFPVEQIPASKSSRISDPEASALSKQVQ